MASGKSSQYLSGPSKPLKILTIDGGGLQAITSLLIIDELLETIRKQNNAKEKPRPCEVFDMIGGIDAGGWLALLLGRFCLDVPTCLLEWSKLMGNIAPRSSFLSEKRRLTSDSWFDRKTLLSQVEELCGIYATGDSLIEDDPVPRVRSKYVFVAALSDAKKYEYNLFRSYSLPKEVADRALRGPSKPESYKICNAFGVTGAAKYFSGPWTEDIASSGRRSFRDRTVPQPHNITELALNEAWDLFGKDVPMDVVVNVGPGLISKRDFKLISRSFSWGTPLSWPHPRDSPLTERIGVTGPQRVNTHGSLKDMTPAHKAERSEVEIEQSIRRKLDYVYERDPPPYYRLAPKTSASGAFKNDASNIKSTSDRTDHYLRSDGAKRTFGSLGNRWSGESARPRETSLRAA